MLQILLASALLAFPTSPVLSGDKLPRDVVAYIARRESCDHWRGEDGYDDARRAEILRGVCKSCAGSDAGLSRLKKKYRANKAVQKRLAEFEPNIEPRRASEHQAMCRAAMRQAPMQ